MQKHNWLSIYVVAVIAGLFVGGSLLAESIGGFIYDLTHQQSHSQLHELDELILVLYGAIVGVLASIIIVTLVKPVLTRKK
jgi:flagellar biosynthesis protein FlhB